MLHCQWIIGIFVWSIHWCWCDVYHEYLHRVSSCEVHLWTFQHRIRYCSSMVLPCDLPWPVFSPKMTRDNTYHKEIHAIYLVIIFNFDFFDKEFFFRIFRQYSKSQNCVSNVFWEFCIFKPFQKRHACSWSHFEISCYKDCCCCWDIKSNLNRMMNWNHTTAVISVAVITELNQIKTKSSIKDTRTIYHQLVNRF